MIAISGRLRAIAALTEPARCICDIGCDHAQLSVYLVQHQKAVHVIATDVRSGPLERGKQTVEQYDLSDRIELRLSDGAKAIAPGEAQGAVIAGMGGMLMERIISEGEAVFRSMDQLVLSPHSDAEHFRGFLHDSGYRILAEDMVFEDGKYYPVMRAASGKAPEIKDPDMLRLAQRYGFCLLDEKNPVLFDYLGAEREKLTKAAGMIRSRGGGGRSLERLSGIEEELRLNRLAMSMYPDK